MSNEKSVSGWLQRWLTAEGFTIEATADGDVIELLVPKTDDRKMRIVIMDSEFIVFSMVSSARVDRKRWHALYPLLSNANSEIVMGAWVLDPDTGLIVFRATIPARGAVYEPDCLKAIMAHVALTVGTMEANFRGTTNDDVLNAWLTEPTTAETPALSTLLDKE